MVAMSRNVASPQRSSWRIRVAGSVGKLSEGAAEPLDGSLGSLSQEDFELGEGVLDELKSGE